MRNTTILLILIFLLALFLRVYKLDTIPPSLNWDEAAIAWNGYSIGQTHLDEYGTKFPLTFRSFGDYKAPGLIYITAVVTRLFGLSIWVIRLPIAIIGTLTVLVLYLLARKIGILYGLPKDKINLYALITSFCLSVSSWHIFFSRGAFEANLALFLTVMGVWLFLESMEYLYILPLCILSFAGAMYSYHSPKLFIPLFAFALLFLYVTKLIKQLNNNKLNFVWISLGVILLLYSIIPLIRVSLMDKGAERLGTSIFYNEQRKPEKLSIELLTHLGSNFISHLDPRFLILGNRLGNYRTELQYSGKITIVEYVFLMTGIYWLLKRKSKISILLISWLLIGIIPAAIGKEVPHGIRALSLLPALLLIVSIGLVSSLGFLSRHRTIIPVLVILYLAQLLYSLHDYFIRFPIYSAYDWQYGMEQVAAISKEYENKVDKILITSSYGQPHVLTYVYQKKDPVDVIYGEMGKKYQFREVIWEGDQFCQRCLVIGTGNEIPQQVATQSGKMIKTIEFPDKKVAFRAVLTN